MLTTNYERLFVRRKRRYAYKNVVPATQKQPIVATRPTIVFDQTNVNRDGLRPLGYGLLFCVHGKLLTQECHTATCRRDAREARANAQALRKRILAVTLQGCEIT